jgi:hypothetical protein
MEIDGFESLVEISDKLVASVSNLIKIGTV